MALFGRITGALRPVCLCAEAAMLSRPAASAPVLGLPRLFSSSAEVDLIPTTNSSGAAFPKDLRSTSGLGKGDNLSTHTSKWLSVSEARWMMGETRREHETFLPLQLPYSKFSLSFFFSSMGMWGSVPVVPVHTLTRSSSLSPAQEGREGPMEMIARVEPIAVESKVVACRGGQNQLGHPVEFIKVYGTSKDEPAVCKYCGLRYYFDGHH